MFLFDTSVLSEMLRKRPNHVLVQRLRDVPVRSQFTSGICVAEMRYGSRRRNDHKDFWTRIEQEVLSKVQVLDIGYRECIYAGDVWASLSVLGRGISFPDLLIAASAVANNLTLITRNLQHFEGVPGLQVQNWFE